jgi:hypothetical protein
MRLWSISTDSPENALISHRLLCQSIHMNTMLSKIRGRGDTSLLFVPDLSLWYGWHKRRDTLPKAWGDESLSQIVRAMGLPVWHKVRSWSVEPGLEVNTEQTDTERTVTTVTSQGVFTARWILGPDGDWWQSEYPVKTGDDLEPVLEIVQALTYVPDLTVAREAERSAGDEDVLAVELPMRPYSDLLHNYFGFTDGLMLLYAHPEKVQQLEAILEEKLRKLLIELAALNLPVYLCPDNLDGSFISPGVFAEHLAASYSHSAETVHPQGLLMVHLGGPIRQLLKPLNECGVDCAEGIAGPPQSDASLAEARAAAGKGLCLWGGIPQDYLLSNHSEEEFKEAVQRAAAEAREDPAIILGIADRVPVDAQIERIKEIPLLLRED